MPEIYASKNPQLEQREIEHGNISRRLAGECIVLLENDGVLPLKKAGKVALYGNGARDTVRGGTGSGDVNTRSNTKIEKGFENAGFTITTSSWLDRQSQIAGRARERYLAWSEEEAKKDKRPVFLVQFDCPYKDPAPALITEEDCRVSDTDTAVYVIARNSGEGADRCNEEGDYLLYPEEKKNLELIAAAYQKTIVVLNIGGVMELSEIKAIQGINAVVLMGQLGNLGGDALLDVLTGKVNPSGKTADTWSKNYMDYPSSEDFSHNGSVHDEYYRDGIYVGYRYFDSFGIRPLYCFGFGRSYTDFKIRTDSIKIEDGKVCLTVTITNTGSEYAGKEVVQVYYSAPQGVLDKPYQELAAYQKTSLLAPGQSEKREISFAIKDMASYSQEEAAWVLEKGEYILRVGNSSADTEVAAILKLRDTVKTQAGENLFLLDCEMQEIRPKAASLALKQREGIIEEIVRLEMDRSKILTEQMKYQGKREEYKTSHTANLTMQEVRDGKCTLEELVAQLTVEELAELCVGTAREGKGCIVGNASYIVPGAAGDTSSVIDKSRGVRKMILADGPAGLRLESHFRATEAGEILENVPKAKIVEESEAVKVSGGCTETGDSAGKKKIINYYQYCTAIPIGWSLAQSWSTEVAAEAGDMVGREMEQFHVDLWLAPAMNIHRNPLCGRNFEYYSEDPLLSGKTAAAVTNGVQKHPGKGTVIKHFAANNQEDNRYFVNARVSERALREIYLKGFEIAVKESQPFSIMTSYNLLNGVHTANHYGLIQGMARDEWGFEGVVMTDWATSQDVPATTQKYQAQYPIAASTGCIFAGNDLQMPGCQKNMDDIIEAVRTGKEMDGFSITLADLQHAAANIIRVAEKTTEGYTDYQLEITEEKGVDINPGMYGLFFEDINYSADGGLYAELLENRSFEFLKALGDKNAYYQEQAYGYHWSVYPEDADSSGFQIKGTNVEYTGAVVTDADDIWDGTGLNENNPHYLEFTATEAASAFQNIAYQGITMKKGEKYHLSFYAKAEGYHGQIRAYVKAGQVVAAEGTVTEKITEKWKKYEIQFIAQSDCKGAAFVVELTQNGTVDFDMFSLMPDNAVAGLFRRDLFDMLRDMKPGFLRFPGGCIVEGNTLKNRYHWKESIGDISERKNNWSRWAVHQEKGKCYSYYNQSLGIGYYEYFLLSELLGAKPMPIVNVGLACEYQSDEKVAVDSAEFQEFIQDTLDLIEFANGSTATAWGAKRAELGHPESFGLELIGIGNEQWEGETYTDKKTVVDYFARFAAFEKAIHERYPEMKLIGCAGETNRGLHYDSAWEYFGQKAGNFVSAVDEHYYTTDEWLLANDDFYDAYDRNRKAKVFVGEYAGTGNSWGSALAEAAYMTGMERNADVVDMASYAPLFARDGYVQWTRADLIYFNEDTVYGTPNYYVQKLYSEYTGDHTLKSKVASRCGKKLYQTVSYRKEKGEAIIKLVNYDVSSRSVRICLPDFFSVKDVEAVLMSGDILAKNSFADRKKVVPLAGAGEAVQVMGQELLYDMLPMSFAVIRVRTL